MLTLSLRASAPRTRPCGSCEGWGSAARTRRRSSRQWLANDTPGEHSEHRIARQSHRVLPHPWRPGSAAPHGLLVQSRVRQSRGGGGQRSLAHALQSRFLQCKEHTLKSHRSKAGAQAWSHLPSGSMHCTRGCLVVGARAPDHHEHAASRSAQPRCGPAATPPGHLGTAGPRLRALASVVDRSVRIQQATV